MRKTLTLGILTLPLGLTLAYPQRRPKAPLAAASSGQVLTWNGSAWVPANVSAAGPVSMAGDVSGTTSASVVGALRGKNISTTAPTAGQNLTFDGTNWTPTTPAAQSGGLVAAGTITLSNATSGTHTFTTALPAGSVCQIEPNFDPVNLPSLTYWPSYTTTSVTVNLSAAGSGAFTFMCTAGSN